MRRSFGGMISPVRISRFDCRAKVVPPAGLALTVTSSGPKHSLKAICCASSRGWPRKIRTENSSKAARISAKGARSTARVRSTPSISAPNTGVNGETLMGTNLVFPGSISLGRYLIRARGRLQRAALATVMLTVLLPGTGEALTLRQYFGELSDRDRGAYLSGLMDLLRADPQRESEFVRCVHD